MSHEPHGGLRTCRHAAMRHGHTAESGILLFRTYRHAWNVGLALGTAERRRWNACIKTELEKGTTLVPPYPFLRISRWFLDSREI